MPHFTTADGVRLHFARFGNPSPEAPRLLLLSPSATTIADLQPLISGPGGVAKLDREFACLMLDYRGIGSSSKPGEPKPWPAPSLSIYVDDVIELLHHVGWRDCHIVAFSFGAAVAQEMLLRTPSLYSAGRAFTARRVLLVCPAADLDAEGTGAGSYPLHALLDLEVEQRAERMLFLADTRRGWDWFDSDMGAAAMHYMRGVEERLRETPGALEGRKFQYLARKEAVTCDRLAVATGGAMEAPAAAESVGSPAVAAQTNAGLAESGRLLANCNAQSGNGPPLYEEAAIIGAVFDAIAPPAAVKRLHASLRGSQLLWFASGHWPTPARECPGLFSSAAIAFLRGHPCPAAVLEASAEAETQIPARGTWCVPCSGGDECVIL